MLIYNNTKFVNSRFVACTKNLSDTYDFDIPATKWKGHTTDLNIVKMKKTNFDNLRAATTAGPSETEALFSNEFKLFTESLTK